MSRGDTPSPVLPSQFNKKPEPATPNAQRKWWLKTGVECEFFLITAGSLVVVVLAFNLLVDIAYAFIDPRVRLV